MVRHTDSTATREFIDFANLNINLATDTLTPTGAFSVTWAVHSVNPKLGTVAAYYLDADTGKWAPLSFTYVAGTPSVLRIAVPSFRAYLSVRFEYR